MKSKTSFFNKTVFKKNLTRFAPVMAVYTLCLILGMMMLYQINEEMGRTFWFASRIAGNLQLMGLVNLLFAPLVAMLLFGDLYNSRMCNALHAMPMRPETLFLTNVVSGLLFSMIPTAVMALLSVPLLNATIVENAWQIALLWYVGTNLQFITFFGVAIFSVFCTGNRFAMAVVYAVLNGGAFILYYIINTLYTPMLFGVVTPDRRVSLLTPVADMTNGAYVAVEDFHQLSLRFYGRESEMVAAFSVDGEKFTSLLIYAAVGIVFAIVGLLPVPEAESGMRRGRHRVSHFAAAVSAGLRRGGRYAGRYGRGILLCIQNWRRHVHDVSAPVLRRRRRLVRRKNASEAHHPGVPAAQLDRAGASDRHGRREPGRYPL